MALGGKYAHDRYMREVQALQSHLPETKRFTNDNFYHMINKYGVVIVKPTFGSGGVGVIKVSHIGKGKFIIHTGARKASAQGKEAAYKYIKQLTGSKHFIVQQYISLAKVNGRPIDFRVMVQRKKEVPWTVTGKLAKVAGSNHFITNIARSKGYVLPAMTALTKSFSQSKSSIILADLNRIGLLAARQLGRIYGYRIFGFDMAVDVNGKTWIIESNSKPALSLFLKLKDKSQYQNIIRFRRP